MCEIHTSDSTTPSLTPGLTEEQMSLVLSSLGIS